MTDTVSTGRTSGTDGVINAFDFEWGCQASGVGAGHGVGSLRLAIQLRPQGRSERDQLLGGRSTGTGATSLVVRIPSTAQRRRWPAQ